MKRIMKGLGSAVLLATLVFGAPLALATWWGNPWPTGGWAEAQLLGTSTIIGALVAVGWLAWAQMTLCVVLEAVALLGHRDTRPLRFALPGQQDLARRLVAAVATIGLSSSIVAGAAAGAGLATTSAPAVAQHARADAPVTAAAANQIVTTETTTAWRLAQAHLGDGAHWKQILEVNRGARLPDGSTFTDGTQTIPAGSSLQLPPRPDVAALETEGVRVLGEVKQGDTLWGFAEENLGDGTRYREVFEASRHLEQPVPMVDPDLIYPGQQIAIPASDKALAEAPGSEDGAAVHEGADTGSANAPSRPDIAADQVTLQTPAADPAPAVSASPDRDAVSGSAAGPADDAEDDSSLPGWLLPAFAAGGALLAGAALIGVRQRRAAAGRKRRPGRVPAPTPTAATEVERSIEVAGATTADVIEQLDLILKRLSDAVRAAGTGLPTLVAIEVTDTAFGLHLRSAAEPPASWITTEDGRVWIIDRNTDPADLHNGHGTEPWPLLVTVGADANGATWLLNLEGVVLSVTGDPDRGRDFVRYLAAEVAVNPWSLWTELDLVGVGAELAPIAPSRIRHHDDALQVASDASAAAIKTMDWLVETGDADVPAGRCRDEEADAWPSRMLILDSGAAAPEVDALTDLVATHEARTATAMVVTAEDGRALNLVIDEKGRLVAPSLGLVLTGVAMTQHEAEKTTLLLTHLDAAADVPPENLESSAPAAAFASATGSLRDEHVADRHSTTIEDAVTLLPKPDDAYVAAGATTTEDLAVLAPKVLRRVADEIHADDPDLDADLAQWRAVHCDRPRLSLLGAPMVRATGTVESRRAFHTALFAYLWSRPQGATRDEVAAAMGLRDGSQAGKHVGVLRSWLGAAHVPDARQSPAGQARGVGAYEVLDVLVDFDLFRRLRIRAQASGPEGIADLEAALALVRGEPLSGTDPKHWSWSLQGSRLDHEAVVAIVDVAHTVVTARLAEGEATAARAAVAVALKAGPYEEIARLDLAAVLSAEGHEQQAAQVISEDVFGRVDDGDVPDDVPARTSEILEGQRKRKRAV